jgi:hypothetical protein
MDRSDIQRRGFLMAAAATSAVAAGGAHAKNGPGSIQTDNAPKELAGKPMPEPSASLYRARAPSIDLSRHYFGGSANISPSGHRGPTGMSSNVIMPARPNGKSSSSLCASAGSVTFTRKTAPEPSLFANH